MGRKVGMNDMWDAMCHEERKKRCSTPRYVFSTKRKTCSVEEERKRGKKRGEEKRKEKEKKEERQHKGKRTSSSLINKQRSCKQ